MKQGWRTVNCGNCAGCGMVSDFRGGDFNGPMDCPDCGGSGAQWVSPQGRIADYPGGPFRGYATDRELTAAKEPT